MIHKNIPKPPTQHLTYQPHHLVDVRQREGDREMERESHEIKKSTEWTVLNGFSTLYYEDISPFFHSHPTCTDTLLSSTHYPPHGVISLTLYYSHTKHSTQCLADVLSPTAGPTTFPHFSKLALLSYWV